jgi:hypothetical protein
MGPKPTDSGLSSGAAKVVACLREREDELADTVVSRLVGEGLFAGDEWAEMREELRSFCAAHVRAFLNAAAEARPVAIAELPGVPEPRWVTDDASFQDAMKGFEIGHRCYWEAIDDCASRLGVDAADALSVARLATDWFQVVSPVIARAYREADEAIVLDEDRRRRDLLTALLSGHLPLTGASRVQAAADGFGDSVPYVVAAIEISEGGDPTTEREVIRAIRDGTERACARALLGLRSDRLVGLLAPRGDDLGPLRDALWSTVARLSSRRKIDIAVGVSTLVSDLQSAREAYHEAERALGWARPAPALLVLPLVSVVDYLVASADETARRIPSPADALSGTDIDITLTRETLQAYWEVGLNVRRAAEHLGIHANTVRYRLRRVEESTGLELGDSGTLLELLLTLRLRDRSAPRHQGEQKRPGPAQPL